MKVLLSLTQVLSYQKHVQSLKKMRPGIKIDEPWKPSFSLSKRLNKYHKCIHSSIQSSTTKSPSKIKISFPACSKSKQNPCATPSTSSPKPSHPTKATSSSSKPEKGRLKQTRSENRIWYLSNDAENNR